MICILYPISTDEVFIGSNSMQTELTGNLQRFDPSIVTFGDVIGPKKPTKISSLSVK